MTTDLTYTEDRLRDVIPGVAQFNSNWTAVTFGTYANGGDVSASLADQRGARSIVITGGTGSGKTVLLRSLYAGAADAGIQTRALIDPFASDANSVVKHFHTLASEESVTRPLSLLLVDDLTGFNNDTIAALAEVARLARRSNMALVVASQDVRMGGHGGPLMQHLTDATLVQFDSDRAPGVGTLNGELFRAWYAA